MLARLSFVACVLGVLLLPRGASAQIPDYYDPVTGRCEAGAPCTIDISCTALMPGSHCAVPTAGPGACRPPGAWIECCSEGMCSGSHAAVRLGEPGIELCLCVPEPLTECFGGLALAELPGTVIACTHDPGALLPARALSEGDCDLDECRNVLDPDPCAPTPAATCRSADAGPGDAGPDMGPDASRDAGAADTGARDAALDGAADTGARDAGPDATDAGEADAGSPCPAEVLPEEDCGESGLGNGCDDDANGLIDDGCVGPPLDAGPPEDDAATAPEDAAPPEDTGGRRDGGRRDAGPASPEDAGEPPQMDSGAAGPAAEPRVFRGSGGCGACTVGGRDDARAPRVAGALGLLFALGARLRRARARRRSR